MLVIRLTFKLVCR